MRTLAIAAAVGIALASSACNRPSSRTDAMITSDVKKQLSDQHVPGSIDVATSKKVVTLTGTVPDKPAKDHAEDIANDVKGVDRVVNEIHTTMAGDAPVAQPHVAPPLGNPAAPAPGQPRPMEPIR
jgi:Flp pilus assembly secretin CpaC